MDRFVRLGPWLLVAWTLLLWISRLRNVLANDELTSLGRGVRLGVVVVFVALAAWAGWAWKSRNPTPMIVLVVWTVGYWLVRGTGILIDDYTVGFKAVHTVLAAVSFATSWLGYRAWRRAREQTKPAPASPSVALGG